ncbi:uncharacterized protein FIBRA_02891 [Fibroporia radiculosa]|uniref:DUF7729 domain-containing protein n=1 Tax=Fibroporia radiculosa TaxID=599839 RepID=J4G381_9APHY|nr:uncharacterized protein FIBRA_02891 [Fibroporia radiculosa]CCM00848.1 predicted protein [Fibroporia radiculosa]
MKFIAVAPLFAAVALASSSPPALIPTGISANCTQFLTTFNADTSLSSCTSPLISATSQFGPNASDSSDPSASTVESSLGTLCGSTSACSSSSIRTSIASFYAACTTELTSSPNAAVQRTYDVLYSLIPLSQAMCSKDDNGKYCVLDISSAGTNSSGVNNGASSSSGAFSSISSYLWSSASSTTPSVSKRQSSSSQAPISIVPNVTTFSENNILFLFLSPNLSSSELCTTCTRNILTSYIAFETDVPYAPGINESPLMKGQSALYEAVQNTCGAGFLSGAAEAAGSLSGGLLGSGAPKTIGTSTTAICIAMGTVFLGLVAIL